MQRVGGNCRQAQLDAFRRSAIHATVAAVAAERIRCRIDGAAEIEHDDAVQARLEERPGDTHTSAEEVLIGADVEAQ